MSRKGYANARDVLPPKLLELVQRYHNGLLWIPPSEGALTRHEQIHQMHASGLPNAEIAERVGLSKRRVRQILKTPYQHAPHLEAPMQRSVK
jgi:DNA-binding NarL/FixJ family response regulator